MDAIMSLGNGNDFVSCLVSSVASIQPEIFGMSCLQRRIFCSDQEGCEFNTERAQQSEVPNCNLMRQRMTIAVSHCHVALLLDARALLLIFGHRVSGSEVGWISDSQLRWQCNLQLEICSFQESNKEPPKIGLEGDLPKMRGSGRALKTVFQIFTFRPSS